MPLLHGDFAHLIGNTLPSPVVGTALLYLYPDSARIVLPAVVLRPRNRRMALWPDSVHIGASGLVYGFVSYVFVAGLLRRDRRAIAASLLVSFMYGALVWGVLPIKTGVSWEGHLSAAVIGVVLRSRCATATFRRAGAMRGRTKSNRRMKPNRSRARRSTAMIQRRTMTSPWAPRCTRALIRR